MHYYQFNIGDYKSHTDHLTNLEDLGYRRLLDWLYLHEKPLPSDENKVARLIRMGENQSEISTVLNEFFKKTTDGWVHNRVNEEVNQFKAKQDTARSNGKKAITNNQEPETNIKEKSLSKANALPSEVSQIFDYWVNTMQKPINQTQLTPKRKKAISDRLKNGYTVEAIKAAIYNCSNDGFSMGQNDRNKPFNDIELICRTGEKLESFIERPTINSKKDDPYNFAMIDAITFDD